MTELLARLLVDVCIFFEFASDDTVDPDAALTQLENLVYRLSSLPKEDRDEVAAAIVALADGDRFHTNYIRELPASLGLDRDRGD
jgi:hypothetical protein